MNNLITQTLAAIVLFTLLAASGCHWIGNSTFKWVYDGVPHSLTVGESK